MPTCYFTRGLSKRTARLVVFLSLLLLFATSNPFFAPPSPPTPSPKSQLPRSSFRLSLYSLDVSRLLLLLPTPNPPSSSPLPSPSASRYKTSLFALGWKMLDFDFSAFSKGALNKVERV